MMEIIDRTVQREIALEIQENIGIPSFAFIRLAKRAGVKFTFGTNARNRNAGNFRYCLKAAEVCGLRADDFLSLDLEKD